MAADHCKGQFAGSSTAGAIDAADEPRAAAAQSLERASGKRHTLTQLLDAFKNRNRSADKAAAAALGRDDAEWLAGELLLAGHLGLEFGFTACEGGLG